MCTCPSYLSDRAIWVSCGKCDSCRLDRAREWSIRLANESIYYSCSSFVTLTFHDQFLPSEGVLPKRPFQLFMKRLRKSLPGREIRYYMGAEYGSRTFRQHYHVILFGVGRCVNGCRVCSDAALVKPPADSDCDLLERAWSEDGVRIGIVDSSGVGIESCRYVANYIQKGGEVPAGWDPPFSLMSKGLGKRFALDNQEKLYSELMLRNGEKMIAIPRYFRKVYAESFGDLRDVAKWYMATATERAVSDKEARRQWHLIKGYDFDWWILGGYAQYLRLERKQRQFVIDALRSRSESVRDTRYVS